MSKYYYCPHCKQRSDFSSICNKCSSTAPCVPVRIEAPITIHFPLSNHAECEMKLTGPINREDFQRLKALLDLAEAGLVDPWDSTGDKPSHHNPSNKTGDHQT